MSLLLDLKPAALWQHFQSLCDIPRPSRHETAVCQFIKQFADDLGLGAQVDGAGNLIIRKPATPGMEDREGIILQAHLDMVPQKNADTEHDFTTDKIRPMIDGEWVTAQGTTLGADNGIGVAAAMAVLETTNIPHGPLEVLLTIDEESGMTGAKGLKPGLLEGRILLNLDSEREGELCVGCAGGMDVVVQHSYQQEAIGENFSFFRIALTGLKGGHSGQDINRQLGNANKLMARLLKGLEKEGVRLASLKGGTLRNAIPREAFAELAIPVGAEDNVNRIIDEHQQQFQAELSEVEPDLSLILSPLEQPVQHMMPGALQQQWLNAIHAAPCGVARMSTGVKGVVETSNNLAVVRIAEGKIQVYNMVRSLVDSAREDHAEAIGGLYSLLGAQVTKQGAYPGWKPNMESTILNTMVASHQQVFGREPEIKVIHAGLECGLLGSTYSRWDMISFGPTIRFPHSPDEKVHIEAVGNFWDYLQHILGHAPKKYT